MVRGLLLIIFSLSIGTTSIAQKLAIKTNLAYLATTTPNLGVEFAAGKKWSVDISGNYNAWTFWNNGLSLRHVLVQPEARYWFCKSFEGHFVGVHGHWAKYNMGQIPFIPDLDKYTYRGHLYGAGISYGYHFAIGRRWGLELSLGAGYAYMEYDKYVCSECAELMGRYKRNYFGPTKLGVSIIYLIH